MNPNPNFNPESNKTNKLEKEMKPLAVYPIFRANDLYCAMFPEIKPLFDKGEKPTTKKVWEEIIKHKNQSIVFDNTCLDVVKFSEQMDLEEFPAELEALGLKPKTGEDLDIDLAKEIFKQKFNIDFSMKFSPTIDERIKYSGGHFDSLSEEFNALLGIAKEKNPNVKNVFIIEGNLADHVDGEFSRNDGKISEIMKNQVKKELGLDAEIVSSFSEENLDPETLVIVDRHNAFAKVVDKMPRLISVLPFKTDMYNTVKFLQSEGLGDNFAKELRKIFEVAS